MNAHDAFEIALRTSRFVVTSYLSDLSDPDIAQSPADGANPLAWQLGHLVKSEHDMLNGIRAGASPALPPGFSERYGKEKASNDGPFDTKATYLDLMERQRAATLVTLGSFGAEQLDEPGPEGMKSYAPTIGAVFAMIAGHEMLHSGQIAVLRRRLGKPIVI
jgi:uncharacterized damage-inducible protein DinB